MYLHQNYLLIKKNIYYFYMFVNGYLFKYEITILDLSISVQKEKLVTIEVFPC